ncbi:MAG: RNA methyltransferase [Bacteroidota bacterium]
MLSKSQIKLINSLSQKKFRNKHNLFVAEGEKSVIELLKSNVKVKYLFGTDTFINKYSELNIEPVSPSELKKISLLKSPNQVVGVFEIPKVDTLKNNGLTLVLDEINDPGNLGTIIRLCDWFDVSQLVCSLNTVDCFNPKVVQATMGSLSRISIVYTDIEEFLINEIRPVYGAFLEGENIYKKIQPTDAVLVIGNEANGISASVEKIISNKITIPQFGKTQNTESLNAAMATAILLSEFKRSLAL